ncbi:MAG: amidohydrolase [Betaproteobacteria bacterium]|nr:amidohydrolase [Betaproteobacteria bacterium]
MNHPVLDADGHWREFPPLLVDALRRIGGPIAANGFEAAVGGMNSRKAATPGPHRRPRSAWWLNAGNTLDRATAVLPGLMHQRLDELGIDFMVVYPSYGLLLLGIEDDAARRAACRAYNVFQAEQFDGLSRRMAPVAVVPMHTPEEAPEELDHVRALGLKVVTLGSMMRRVNPTALTDTSTARHAIWHDTLALDSNHDCDPVWARCEALRLPVTFHTPGTGSGFRVSPTNFIYNHIGHFASTGEAVCKAMFLGGVTYWFPNLRFCFMEGGVGWACTLYRDLVGHWRVRNLEGVRRTSPGNLETDLFISLVEKHGGVAWRRYLPELQAHAEEIGMQLTIGSTEPPPEPNDFAACRIERAEDIRDAFVPNFYFGCEAEDAVSVAFDTRNNPCGGRINALFSSDVSHFDVPDTRGVLPETYEGVEEDILSTADFRDFVFANGVIFLGHLNREFFDGTAIAAEARQVLAAEGNGQTI